MRTMEQRRDLVLQERKKRAKNHGYAVIDNRGDLETEGFPATRAFENEHVAFGEGGLNDDALIVSEEGIAKNVMQGEVWWGGSGEAYRSDEWNEDRRN